jgi:hypothetical protein
LHRPQEELSDDTAPNNRPSVERVMQGNAQRALMQVFLAMQSYEMNPDGSCATDQRLICE